MDNSANTNLDNELESQLDKELDDILDDDFSSDCENLDDSTHLENQENNENNDNSENNGEMSLKTIIESLLFVAFEPLEIKTIVEITGATKEDVKEKVLELQEEYSKKGFNLMNLAGGYQFVTDKKYAMYVERLYKPKTTSLSKAALETLAIVAYRQPVTRLEMEQIRQIKVEGVLAKLLEKGLVKEVGRMEGPGRAILYGTTKEFLDFFGLNSIKELPPLEQFTNKLNEGEEVLLFNKEQYQEEIEEVSLENNENN